MNNIENNTQNAPEEVKATAEEVKDNETTMCWVWHKRVLAKRLLIYCPCSP